MTRETLVVFFCFRRSLNKTIKKKKRNYTGKIEFMFVLARAKYQSWFKY